MPLEIGVGGNAVGTGINTKTAFRSQVVATLNASTGLTSTDAANMVTKISR